MTSYLITPDEDTLKVGFNRKVSAEGDRIACDARARLRELIESEQLQGGKLLKIDGPQSLLVSYLIAHELGHLYGAIAVCDTRLGAYIVVTSTCPDYPFGSRIDRTTGEVTPCAAENFKSVDAPSIRIGWDGKILKPQLNGEIAADGDRIVLEARAQLQALIESGRLKGGREPLLINGRCSVAAGFVIAQQVAHLYGAIAVYDPKIGDRGLDKYVVVISHDQHCVGDTIDLECQPSENLKVVLCGPPNTGKTCLREGLKQALLKTTNAPDSYIISGCPDGDGAWFSETARNYPDLARKLKDEYKAKFTPEFAEKKAKDVEVIKNSILVFDVGGKISPENRLIMAKATHAVILANTEAEVKQWQAFCDELHLPVIAILYSDYHGTRDSIENESPLLVGSVHHLDRSQETFSRPAIQKLARVLIDLVP